MKLTVTWNEEIQTLITTFVNCTPNFRTFCDDNLHFVIPTYVKLSVLVIGTYRSGFARIARVGTRFLAVILTRIQFI